MSATSGKALGHHGIQPPGMRPDYKAYRSPHGPKYTIGRNFHGMDSQFVRAYGSGALLFVGTLGVAGIFFLSDLPKVRKDIMVKLPIIGPYFRREIAPEDNPF